MYSVLIQNQSTMESFHEYHPLFMEAIINNQIGVCRWVESGNSVETALPELRDLTVDKDCWRAIIVRVVDEVEMRAMKADRNNPYDFAVNRRAPEELRESRVPLIRLTHILGGIPSPAVEFREKKLEEEGKAARVVYTPVRNVEKEAAHEELERKYKYDGKRPSEILLVTFHRRGRKKESSRMQFVWNNYLESESSDFWKRNNYPGACRFMKYDYEELGPVQRTADLFNFWTSVMLLSRNDVNSSALQGYRLYNISVDIDRDKLKRIFQEQVDTLVGTKNYIGTEIRREQEERASIDETAVMDFASVEGLYIKVDVSHDTMLKVSENEFHICGRTSNEDYSKWDSMKNVVESNLDMLYKRADRELEKGTDLMRLKQHIEDEDVKPVNHFQEEDICAELDGLYVQILNGQSELKGLSKGNQKKLDDRSRAVKEYIPRRVTRISASSISGYVILGILVCCVPSIFLRRNVTLQNVLMGLLLTAGMVAAYLVAEFVALQIQHFEFLRKVDAYNDEVEELQEDLENSTKHLTEFVRDVVAYSRGCDYLNIIRRKRFKTGYTYEALQRHMKAVNLFLEKLRKWSKAFYVDINFQPEAQDNFRIDIELSPAKNYLYTFENGKEYAVPVNETGEEMFSPFEFVKKFNIDREELFEDARVDEGNNGAGNNNAGADGTPDSN